MSPPLLTSEPFRFTQNAKRLIGMLEMDASVINCHSDSKLNKNIFSLWMNLNHFGSFLEQ